MCCLEGLLPESGFLGHHYSVLKERLRAPLVGALACFFFRARRRSVSAPRRGPAPHCVSGDTPDPGRAHRSLRTA